MYVKEVTDEYRKPWLVQRLKQPIDRTGNLKFDSNVFAFGGGLKNGGLSQEAMAILRGIWRYDYMGSAEFEFGAIPESMRVIIEGIKKKKYVTNQIEVEGKVSSFWIERDKNAKPCAKSVVYYICNASHVSGFENWLAAEAAVGKARLKEHLGLGDNICGLEYKTDLVGWHDIDNHLLFFTDKTMFENICKVFNL